MYPYVDLGSLTPPHTRIWGIHRIPHDESGETKCHRQRGKQRETPKRIECRSKSKRTNRGRTDIRKCQVASKIGIQEKILKGQVQVKRSSVVEFVVLLSERGHCRNKIKV